MVSPTPSSYGGVAVYCKVRRMVTIMTIMTC
jgi:hypothetical protein